VEVPKLKKPVEKPVEREYRPENRERERERSARMEIDIDEMLAKPKARMEDEIFEEDG
jgi:hypothetical protein